MVRNWEAKPKDETVVASDSELVPMFTFMLWSMDFVSNSKFEVNPGSIFRVL